jgi:hypothetical protein
MKHFNSIGVHVGKATIAMTNLKTEFVKPKTIRIDNANQEIKGDIVPWGSDNLYPQNFYNKKFLKNGSAVGGVGALQNAHYGSGFELQLESEGEDGASVKKIVPFLKYPDIQAFVRNSKLKRFWNEIIADQTLFSIGFAHFVVSKDFKTITSVRRQKAAWCRFEKMGNDGVIKHVWINSDWSNENKEYSYAIPVVDPYMSAEEVSVWCQENQYFEFIYPSYYPLIDESYYPKPGWHAVDRNGWMDVANSVPELKQAIFQNQAHIKYIIYVSEMYFENFYKEEWDEFDSDKRQKIRNELVAAIDSHMAGNSAGGRSIISPIFEENGKFVEGIKVVPIDNNLQDGSYLPDASAANSEILFALGVDPCIIGLGIPGGKNLSGSGSDKREAYNILCANLKPRREITLEIWELLRDFNSWDPNLEGCFPNMVLTTLDKEKSGQNQIVN